MQKQIDAKRSIPDKKHSVVKNSSKHEKVILSEKSKQFLEEYNGVIRSCNADSIFIDDDLRSTKDFYNTEDKLYNLHKEIMHSFNCFCINEPYPHLRNLHNQIEKYHSKILLKEETPKFKEFMIYSDFLLEVELLTK
jgi:hypothetical protein